MTPRSNRFLSRELSWLAFNGRVLDEGADAANPLLDRLGFLGIVSSNCDEFFMVRIASLDEEDEDLPEVHIRARELQERRDRHFDDVCLPAMRAAGIVRVLPSELDEAQRAHVKQVFTRELHPVLTPIALWSDHPVPSLTNLSLYLALELAVPDKPKSRRLALIEMPRNHPRMISLPSTHRHAFILIEDVVALHATELFHGHEILQHGVVRLTRAAELSFDEEQDADFAKVLSGALRSRRSNEIMRLEANAPAAITDALKKQLRIPDRACYFTTTWVDLRVLHSLYGLPHLEEFRRPPWTPKPVPEITAGDDVFQVIRARDILVHHPYESFDVFLRFLQDAAEDPDVLAIKQTLYRAADPSAVVAALERAAERGKQVTVLVELKARFDEERNIGWAHRLEQAGASVLYGVAGLKTHAKACLVVRREREGIRRYVHLSTGNYNEKTSRFYTDFGLFSANEALTRDVAAFFNVLTGYSQPVDFQRIEIAPFGLRARLDRLIQRETINQGAKPGLIMAKMNALVDPALIEALYKASQAGVRIRLNVRGVCCLRPGVKGLSENIEVVSIIDMFLEHSRVFHFQNGGNEEVYLASADWMPRNLDRRLELMFPVDDPRLRKELIEFLGGCFRDNQNAWALHADGSWRKREPEKERRFRLQEHLSRKAAESEKARPAAPIEIKPQRPK
jgi:polyphosphate kinase